MRKHTGFTICQSFVDFSQLQSYLFSKILIYVEKGSEICFTNQRGSTLPDGSD